MVCLALELVGPCVVLGFSVGMEAFDELLSINVPWSQEFPGVGVTARGAGWIAGRGTKIPTGQWHGQNKKKA